MTYTIFQPHDLPFVQRADDDPRQVARLSDALVSSRASVWRLPSGCKGKRHAEHTQEEVFVVMEGTLTIDLGEPPVRHVVARGGVVIVPAGTILQLRNAHEDELRLFIYGAPPESGADIHPDVP
jgi:mannose-6-phosphate isomerase-like protein (cupin superfamily)